MWSCLLSTVNLINIKKKHDFDAREENKYIYKYYKATPWFFSKIQLTWRHRGRDFFHCSGNPPTKKSPRESPPPPPPLLLPSPDCWNGFPSCHPVAREWFISDDHARRPPWPSSVTGKGERIWLYKKIPTPLPPSSLNFRSPMFLSTKRWRTGRSSWRWSAWSRRRLGRSLLKNTSGRCTAMVGRQATLLGRESRSPSLTTGVGTCWVIWWAYPQVPVSWVWMKKERRLIWGQELKEWSDQRTPRLCTR